MTFNRVLQLACLNVPSVILSASKLLKLRLQTFSCQYYFYKLGERKEKKKRWGGPELRGWNSTLGAVLSLPLPQPWGCGLRDGMGCRWERKKQPKLPRHLHFQKHKDLFTSLQISFWKTIAPSGRHLGSWSLPNSAWLLQVLLQWLHPSRWCLIVWQRGGVRKCMVCCDCPGSCVSPPPPVIPEEEPTPSMIGRLSHLFPFP